MNKKKLLTLLLALLVVLGCVSGVYASSPTDEILLYEIRADVNDDASVELTYHIVWKVLESDSIGPMSWITVGIANSHCENCRSISDNIDSLYVNGYNLEVYLDREYYEGEVADIEFALTQDYLYSMNKFEEGYSSYSFTPGWFDGIYVDEYCFRWNAENASGWSPDCLHKDGYLTWTGSLDPGSSVTLRVDYPVEAFGFTEGRSIDSDTYYDGYYDDWEYDNWDDGEYDYYGDGGYVAAGMFVLAIFFIIARKAKKEFDSNAGFATGETTKKVTRTKIEYYPVCQGCGAPRPEGKDNCAHCGRSFIKSEEILSEEEIKDEDKEALKYKKNGTYAYSSSPNTFVRVNVVHVPVARSGGSGRSHSSGGGSRSGGTRSGGCVHSSCACACASCACACACTCAGGGRAGCTTKDFYNTGLKLEQLEMKKAAKANNGH